MVFVWRLPVAAFLIRLLLLSQVFLRDRYSRRPQQTSSHNVGTRGTTGDVGKTCRMERRGDGEMKKRIWAGRCFYTLLFGFVRQEGIVSLSVRPTVRLKDQTFSSRFNWSKPIYTSVFNSITQVRRPHRPYSHVSQGLDNHTDLPLLWPQSVQQSYTSSPLTSSLLCLAVISVKLTVGKHILAPISVALVRMYTQCGRETSTLRNWIDWLIDKC